MSNAKTKEDARQYAIDYQVMVSNGNMSTFELLMYQIILEKLAKEFDLTEEFIENGIL